MRLRENYPEQAFTSLSVDNPLMPSSTTHTLIWRKCIQAALCAKQFSDIEYAKIELFHDSLFPVLKALDDKKGNQAIKLNLHHKTHTHYDNGKNSDRFDSAFDALEWLCLVGIKYKNEERYCLLDHLKTLDIFRNPGVLPHLKKLILLTPGSQEFLLDEVDLEILLKYPKFKTVSKKKFLNEFDQWLPFESNPVPIYYFTQEEKVFSLVTLKESYATNDFLKNVLPKYKKDAELFAKRQECIDRAKIISDFTPLAPFHRNLILEYLAKGKYLSDLAQILIEQLPVLQAKYSSEFKQLSWNGEFPKQLTQIFQAIIDDQPIGESADHISWYFSYEYKAIKKIEGLIRGIRLDSYSDSQPLHFLKFLKDLAVKDPVDPTISIFTSHLLELTNMSVLQVSKTLLNHQCPKFLLRASDDNGFSCYEYARKDLHSFLSRYGCQNPNVDYSYDDKLTDQVTLYTESDPSAISVLECLAYFKIIPLSESFLNLILKRLLTFTSDWSAKKQIELVTSVITMFIPNEFAAAAEKIHVTQTQESTLTAGKYHKYRVNLELPYHQIQLFRLFEKQALAAFQSTSDRTPKGAVTIQKTGS